CCGIVPILSWTESSTQCSEGVWVAFTTRPTTNKKLPISLCLTAHAVSGSVGQGGSEIHLLPRAGRISLSQAVGLIPRMICPRKPKRSPTLSGLRRISSSVILAYKARKPCLLAALVKQQQVSQNLRVQRVPIPKSGERKCLKRMAPQV